MRGRTSTFDHRLSGFGLALIALVAGAVAPARAVGPTQEPVPINRALIEAARKYFPGNDTAKPPKRIVRLTRDQLDVTAATLLPSYKLPSIKEVMPRDPLQTNYEYAELLSLNAANTNAIAGWAGEIARRARERPKGLFDCQDVSASSECLATAAQRFIQQAFRADVADEKVIKLIVFFLSGVKSAGLPQAAGDLVEVVLNTPDFLFRKEIDTDRSSRLTPAQQLQAITYTLADAPPERLGLDSTKAAQLLRLPAESNALIGKAVASKDAREKLVRFFKAWLEIREPGELNLSRETFPELTPDLANALLASAEWLLRSELAKPSPRLDAITQAVNVALPKGLEPAERARSGAGAPAQRLGIFTAPGVIASHSGPTNTRLVKRGVFWARKVMCMELEPPPQEVHEDLYGTLVTTERARIEQATKRTACIGCHKVINPLGFFQERWDALGRWRSLDNGHPIDTSISFDFLDEGPVRTSSPVEAVRVLTGSPMFKQCFARQMFRFYIGRTEEPADDPLLRRLFLELTGGEQDILRLLTTLASSDRVAMRQGPAAPTRPQAAAKTEIGRPSKPR